MTRHISQLEPIFCVQDCHFQIAQIEYQGQTHTLALLPRVKSRYSASDKIHQNSWLQTFVDTCYCIGHILNGNIFTSHILCSMLIKQLIDLRKVRAENLKFRTDLRDRVVDGWSVIQSSNRLLKRKFKKSNIVLSVQVYTWLLDIAFRLWQWTVLAANLVAIN